MAACTVQARSKVNTSHGINLVTDVLNVRAGRKVIA